MKIRILWKFTLPRNASFSPQQSSVSNVFTGIVYQNGKSSEKKTITILYTNYYEMALHRCYLRNFVRVAYVTNNANHFNCNNTFSHKGFPANTKIIYIIIVFTSYLNKIFLYSVCLLAKIKLISMKYITTKFCKESFSFLPK